MSTSTIKRGQLTRGVATKGLIFESEFVVTGELKFNLLGDYNFTPSENIGPSTSLLSGTISSGSASGAVTFTLDNDAEGRISIASTGNKTFSISTTGHGFNHSIQTSYPFKVRAVDSAGDIITRSGTINVTDVDNSPTVTSSLTDCAYVQGVHPRTGIGLGTASGRIRVLTTAYGQRSTYSISGARELGTWIVPDVDGEGASVYLNRVTQPEQGGTESAALTASDRTFTVSHKGDDSTAQTATLAAGATISGPTTPLPSFQWELGTTQGISFTIPNVRGNVNIPHQNATNDIYYSTDSYANSDAVNDRFQVNGGSSFPFLANKAGSPSLNNGESYTFNFIGSRGGISLPTSGSGASLSGRSTSDAHTIGSVYTGAGSTTPAGHTSSNSINFTDDNFLLEETPLPKTIKIVPNVSGQTITFTQNGSDDLEDTLGRSLSGVNNPTINLYVGDTLNLHGSDRLDVKFKDKFLNSDDTLNQPVISGTPSAQLSGGSDYHSFTPTSPGTFYYFNKDDWRGYGVIQVHSRDVQNPFSSGTPVALMRWHNTDGAVVRADGADHEIGHSIGLAVYVRNLYEHTGVENDAGRVSFHKTEAGAKASAADVDRIDFTGYSVGQYQNYSGLRLVPLYKMQMPITVADTTGPSFTSPTTGNLTAGLKGDTTTLYNATATDTGTGVSSYSIVANTSGLNLEIGQYQADGNVTFDGAQTIVVGQTYSFTVRATDSAGNSTDQAVTITGTSAASTHTITQGIGNPVFGIFYYGYTGQEFNSSASAIGSINPNNNPSGFAVGTKIVACRMDENNYNNFNASGADRYRFYITFTGDQRNNQSKSQIVVTSGSTSQTFTFASAASESYFSNYYTSDGGITRYTWNLPNPTSGNSIWDVIAAQPGGSSWSITVS